MFVFVYENGTKMAFLTCEVPPLEEALVLAAQQVAKHRALVETPLVPCRQSKKNAVCIVLFSCAEFVPSLSWQMLENHLWASLITKLSFDKTKATQGMRVFVRRSPIKTVFLSRL